jgi:hypothetical protein
VTAKEEEEEKTKKWTGGLAKATEPCVGSGGLPCVVFLKQASRSFALYIDKKRNVLRQESIHRRCQAKQILSKHPLATKKRHTTSNLAKLMRIRESS